MVFLSEEKAKSLCVGLQSPHDLSMPALIPLSLSAIIYPHFLTAAELASQLHFRSFVLASLSSVALPDKSTRLTSPIP